MTVSPERLHAAATELTAYLLTYLEAVKAVHASAERLHKRALKSPPPVDSKRWDNLMNASDILFIAAENAEIEYGRLGQGLDIGDPDVVAMNEAGDAVHSLEQFSGKLGVAIEKLRDTAEATTKAADAAFDLVDDIRFHLCDSAYT